MAWQYNRPDIGEGMVQAFRRAGSMTTTSRTFELAGLEPAATYTVDDLDTPGTVIKTGAELMDPGLQVDISNQPGSALITYSRN